VECEGLLWHDHLQSPRTVSDTVVGVYYEISGWIVQHLMLLEAVVTMVAAALCQ
jgi:hypothetical protein